MPSTSRRGSRRKRSKYSEPAERWLRENDPGELVYTLDGLGAAHFTLERYDASLAYDTEALALFEQAGEDVRAANSAERVGLAYLGLGRYAEAKDALLDAAGGPYREQPGTTGRDAQGRRRSGSPPR